MPAFGFDHRRLRHTARVTLAAWLFAVTAGVVNACVLSPAGPSERATGHRSHVHAGAAVEHAGATKGSGESGHHAEGGSMAHGEDGQDVRKDGCLKFCDDGSSAIAKAKLPVVDLGPGLLAMGEPWQAIAATGSVEIRQALQRPRSQGPPLVIRLLRLTL